MLDFARHVLRLGRIGWTLARHDALWPLELAHGLETPAMLARLVSRRRPDRRRGQRLTAALQDLVDGLPEIVKAAAGVPLAFKLDVTLGDSGKDVDSDTLESIDKLLREVSPDLRLRR